MVSLKWWDATFASALTLLAVLTAFLEPNIAGGRLGAWASLAFIGASYVLCARWVIGKPTGAAIAIVLLTGGMSAATVYVTTLASLQALVLPFVWFVVPRRSRALVASGLVCAATALALFVGLGADGSAAASALVTFVLSYGFNMSMGLWISTVHDYGAERQRLLTELQAAQEKLAAQHREAGVVSERERFAREIHDTIAQSLTSLVMLAQRGRVELDSASSARAVETMALMESTAQDALAEARGLVATTAAVPADAGGLAQSLERLAERFERETGVDVAVAVHADDLPRSGEVIVLRCVQEALANVRKHAGATCARVSLAGAQQQLTVTVSDDGTGFDPTSDAVNAAGFGLAGMRERVRLVDGDVEVRSAEGEGTTLTVRIPVARAADGSASVQDATRPRAETPRTENEAADATEAAARA